MAGRSLLAACGGSGCLAPYNRFSASAVFSAPTFISVNFSSPYISFASQQPAIAYGICSVIGCSYRNVTVSYVTGDATKLKLVYNVTFISQAGVDPSAFPTALATALPSSSPATPGTIAYGVAVGGALSTLVSISLGYGPFAPPAPPSPPALPSPPPPPLGSVYYACTCTNGFTGLACLTPPPYPSPPPPHPSPRPPSPTPPPSPSPGPPPPSPSPSPPPLYVALSSGCAANAAAGSNITGTIQLCVSVNPACADNGDNYCLVCADGSSIGFYAYPGTGSSCLSIWSLANVGSVRTVVGQVQRFSPSSLCYEWNAASSCLPTSGMMYIQPPMPPRAFS